MWPTAVCASIVLLIGCSSWRLPHIVVKAGMQADVEIHPQQRERVTESQKKVTADE